MKMWSWVVAVAAIVVLVQPAAAIDAVRKVNNSRVSGTIKGITANDVSIDVQGKIEKIPVNEIDAVEYDVEPSELKLARSALKSGGDQSALTQLDKIKAGSVTKNEIKTDLEYYRAYAQGRLALRGSGDLNQAGTAMYTFLQAHPDSYHFLQGEEVLGDLLVATGKVDAALREYAKLDASPYNEFKMRAGSARGRAYMSLKKYPEAKAEFDKVLALPFDAARQKGTPAESQRFAAELGVVQCQANMGEYEQAIKQLEGKIISTLSAEDSTNQALAYNTLGNCYNAKADGKKEALLAFLHTDVLYNTVPSAHAEALWNLSNLWTDIGKNERGQECLNRLNRLYPGSPWLMRKR